MALEGRAVVILLQSMSKHVKTNLTISFILQIHDPSQKTSVIQVVYVDAHGPLRLQQQLDCAGFSSPKISFPSELNGECLQAALHCSPLGQVQAENHANLETFARSTQSYGFLVCPAATGVRQEPGAAKFCSLRK